MCLPSGEYAARAALGMGSFVSGPPVIGTVKSWVYRLVWLERPLVNSTAFPSGVKPWTMSASG
ncbi:hypothetical protein BH09GEM1_BH09GEM1_42150 [soil metagenome]